MSDSGSDDNVIRYGTPLEPYEEDEVPSKRKYQEPADQYAVDAHGRRRFHGAFTGGFSAGFGNTVGSQEGWTPQNFKSSRMEKAAVSSQRPEDFMDEEDRSEFGIAPKHMQTSSEFSGKKRQRPRGFHDGPIPGEPVLDQLLQPVHETAAVRMLRAMGWRTGQGTGDRLARKEKRRAADQHRVYGCYMPPEMRPKEDSDNEDSSDSEVDYETLFAPDDYEPYILSQKSDRFGLGYKGLSRHSVLGNLVGEYGSGDKASRLVMKEKGKKVSIRGQAFGVGAFEADDEDIYSTEDMSHYDFALGPSKDKQTAKPVQKEGSNVLAGFTRSTKPAPTVASYPPPALPRDYTPLPAGTRRSRFEPSEAPQRDQGLGRHELTAEARGLLLGETPPTNIQTNIPTNTQTPSKRDEIAKNKSKDELLAKIMGRNLDFVTTDTKTTEIIDMTKTQGAKTIEIIDMTKNQGAKTIEIIDMTKNQGAKTIEIIDMTKKKEENSVDFISIKDSGKELVNTFKPFVTNPKKQSRYEKYCATGEVERDGDIDRLSEWEREREMVEFEQAAMLYRPLTGIMGDRFTHAAQPDDAVNPLTAVARSAANPGVASAEQRTAAAEGVYGVMTRAQVAWRPDSVVCKRFNVPEPNVTRLEPKKEERPKVSYSVFSYMESSVHDKTSFSKEQGKFSGSKSQRDHIATGNDQKPAADQNRQLSDQSSDQNCQSTDQSQSTDHNSVTSTDQATMAIQKITDQTVPFKRMTVAELFIKESESTKEQGKEVTDTIEKFDKMDLYKSIFLSDSEDEAEETKVENTEKDFVDEVPKNVARNTSPPRGIFANIDFDELNSWRRNDEKPTNDDKPEKVVQMDVETYGPKIPENLKNRLESSNNESYNHNNKDNIPKQDVQVIGSSSDDSWVDAKEVKAKKSKKKKKHKSKDKKKSKHKKKHK